MQLQRVEKQLVVTHFGLLTEDTVSDFTITAVSSVSAKPQRQLIFIYKNYESGL